MTEYWVSQGKKWCDYCKIYIANNATSLRNHEFGQRHKESVAQRLATMRKDNIAKEKEKQQALKDLERIELQAKRSYERDVAAAERLAVSMSDTAQQAAQPPEAPGGAPPAPAVPVAAPSQPSGGSEPKVNEWTYDEKTGYHFNAATGYYYDPNSGLYYSDILGKWTTQEAAHQASQNAHVDAGVFPTTSASLKQPATPANQELKPGAGAALTAKPAVAKPATVASQGLLLKQKPIPGRVGRAVASSLEVSKRKREEKSGPVSSEEAAALAAREAAKKRILDREKSLLGLYQAY